MISCKDAEIADRIRLLRAHGWSRNLRTTQSSFSHLLNDESLDARYTFLEWGFNVRPTELQAGFGIEQLKRLADFIEIRNRNYSVITSVVEEMELDVHFPVVDPLGEPSWFAVPVILGESLAGSRGIITKRLQEMGVETRPIVAGNLAMQPVKRRFEWLRNQELWGASRVHERGFYFGLHPIEIGNDFERLQSCISAAFTFDR